MKKIFIFGYYGFKNLGDEAILSSIIKSIKDRNKLAEIYALSYNVRYTEQIHGIKGVRRNSIRDIVRTIKKCDLVISGGGSLLQDVTSSRSLSYYLGIIIIAKLFKKPVLFFSNGFGPINNSMNKYITSVIVNKVDRILVRDEDSKLAMKKIGIRQSIEVTADATFILESINPSSVRMLLKQEGVSMDEPLVGISVRPWHTQEKFIKIIAKFADYIVSKGIGVVFIPMQAHKDTKIAESIERLMNRKAYILKNEYRPEEVLGIIGVMDLLIGMRLHALIFAAIKGIPMLGLEYDPKIASFLKTVHQENVGKIESLDFNKLCRAFDRLWHRRIEKSLQLTEIVKQLKDQVKQSAEILDKMI